MTATCVIADDEPLAAQLLQKYVKDAGDLELVGVCENALEVASVLRERNIDLLLLDIQMPKLSGIELLRILKNPPSVIITTAHREYALDGYNFNIVDYLLKPISFDRFMAAIEKFHQRRSINGNQKVLTAENFVHRIIDLRSGTKTYRIVEADILYVESIKDYIKIYFANGTKQIIKYKIGMLESQLSPHFIRVHKSFIVNSNKITTYSSSELNIGSAEIPIGNHYRIAVAQLLKQE